MLRHRYIALYTADDTPTEAEEEHTICSIFDAEEELVYPLRNTGRFNFLVLVVTSSGDKLSYYTSSECLAMEDDYFHAPEQA